MNAVTACQAYAGIQKHSQQDLRATAGWRRWLLMLCLVLHGLGLSASVWATNAWQQTSEPSELGGKYVQALATDPIDSATLYAGTYGGVFKSMDEGTSWVNASSGLTSWFVQSLAIDPITPSTLYAGTSDGAFKSTDGGVNWTAVNNGLTSNNVRSFAIDPIVPTTLYAGTDDGVFKSIDGGSLWMPKDMNNGLGPNSVLSLAIDSVTPSTLFAGTNGGVFKSIDAGTNWTLLNDGLGQRSVSSLVINPAMPSTLYAASHGFVFKSMDKGASWTSTSIGSASTYQVLALALHSDGLTLFAGIQDDWWIAVCEGKGGCGGSPGGGVSKSRGGRSWSAANSGLAFSPVTSLAWNKGSQTLFAGTLGHGVFKSTNGVPSSDSRLWNLVLSSGGSFVSLSPDFDAPTLGYTATVQSASATLTPTAWIGDASITVNGASATDGEAMPLALAVGDNLVNVEVTSGDGSSTRTYTVTITRPGPPAIPSDVRATPAGSGQVTVTWTPPANNGSAITGYVVTAQPGGQTCTPAPPTATTCTFTGLTDGQTYTFTVEATNGAGSSSDGSALPVPSNPATPLANSRQFSAAGPSGALTVSVAGGGASCGFEHVQLMPPSSATVAPPAHLHFPHGLLDFVLAGCNQTDVTVTIGYPSALQKGVRYWKLNGNTWAPYSGAVAQAGAMTATLTLRDGDPGDDDGETNGRIVDPGQVAVSGDPAASLVAVPALSPWGLGLLGMSVLWLGRRRKTA